MQQKAKVWIGVALVLLLLGGFGIYQYIQTFVQAEVQDSVAQVLKEHGIEHKDVLYSLSNDSLTIRGIKFTVEALPGSVFHIDELFLSEPNLDALDPAVAGRPLVAKDIVVQNMRGSYTVGGAGKEFTLERVTTTGYKQNLGKVLALHGKGYTEAYFTALLDMSVERIENVNYSEKGQTVLDGEIFDSETTVALVSMKDISSATIGAYRIEGLSAMLREEQGKGALSFKLGSLVWDDITLPSPAYWAFFAQMFPKILDGSLTNEQFAELAQHPDISANLFDKTALTIENVTAVLGTDEEPFDLFSCKNFRLASDFDAEAQTFAKLHVAVKEMGLHAAFLDIDRNLDPLFKEITGDVLFVDASVDLDLEAQKESRLDISLGGKNVGTSRVSLAALLPADFLSYAFSNESASSKIDISEEQFNQWFEESKVASLEVQYKDQGLLPQMLAFASKESNVPAPDMLKGLVPQIVGQVRSIVPQLPETTFASLEQCLNNPGALTLTAKPASPLKPFEAFMSFMANPASLNISATCAPGKNILESMADLK